MFLTKRLNDVYSNWIAGDGIFTDLQALDVPWKDDDIATSLNISYYGMHSGQKRISPLLRAYGELTPQKRALIAQTVYDMYAPYWLKEWETLSFEYNPIENYNMIEKETGSHSSEGEHSTERTDDLTHERTGTETTKTDTEETRTDELTHTKSGTETVTNTGTDTTVDQIEGFNSDSWQDQNKSTKTLDTETETEHDVTESDTGTVGNVIDGTELLTLNTSESDTGTQTTAGSQSESGENERELTRSGNIGVTTSQQMLESERNLWLWNFFEDIVFKDLDKILTLSVY